MIDYNNCIDLHPVPDAQPDCARLLSKRGFAPLADIAITNDIATCTVQGLTALNSPYKKTTIERNFAKAMHCHGIALFGCYPRVLSCKNQIADDRFFRDERSNRR